MGAASQAPPPPPPPAAPRMCWAILLTISTCTCFVHMGYVIGHCNSHSARRLLQGARDGGHSASYSSAKPSGYKNCSWLKVTHPWLGSHTPNPAAKQLHHAGFLYYWYKGKFFCIH